MFEEYNTRVHFCKGGMDGLWGYSGFSEKNKILFWKLKIYLKKIKKFK
jgi:hypothetical protein